MKKNINYDINFQLDSFEYKIKQFLNLTTKSISNNQSGALSDSDNGKNKMTKNDVNHILDFPGYLFTFVKKIIAYAFQ